MPSVAQTVRVANAVNDIIAGGKDGRYGYNWKSLKKAGIAKDVAEKLQEHFAGKTCVFALAEIYHPPLDTPTWPAFLAISSNECVMRLRLVE